MGGAIKHTAGRFQKVLSRLGVDQAQVEDLRGELIELRARSVSLRPLTREHADAWRELVERNREDLLAVGFDVPAEVTDMTEAVVTAEVFDVGYVFGIFRDGELIGEASLTGVVRGNRQTATLSLWVDAGSRGEEVAEEAFVALVGHGLDGLGLHRVEVLALEENEAVLKSLDRVGLSPLGVEPAAMRINGEWRDHLRFVLTAEEWAERGADLRAEFGS